MVQHGISHQVSRGLGRWQVGALMVAVVLVGGGIYGVQRPPQAVTAPVVNQSKPQTVTALGRLEPQGEVIRLSAPTSTNGNRVDQLLVQEGDRVKPGQVIAILDSRDRLQAAVQQAEEQVRVAEARLAQVMAGAKRGEIQAQQAEVARLEVDRQGNIAAQRATIARLTAELQNAEVEFQRYAALYQDGAVSASLQDNKRLAVETVRRTLQEAQITLQRQEAIQPQERAAATATLDRIAEVRPVDVAAAQADVNQAIAAVTQAQANLAQAFVKAPQAGVVMKIQTRAGELISSNGIVELGQTNRMTAVAEVYQSDVPQVAVGQTAVITSNSLPQPLRGKVEWIGWQVQRQQVINTNPSENIDARVVEVYVALDDASSQQAAKFTNLQVQVVITR
jgi:HlyD family secretion protein